jgi:SAM-dependent MidA family methyltransferase
LSKLNEIIGAELARGRAISFARFMELALYCPVYGYYESEKDKIGRAGDFYTSVSVGPLFGELLAFQFCEWLDQLGLTTETGTEPSRWCQICEVGAHAGRLARDILGWIQLHRPDLSPVITYWIIEPSSRRRAWQAEFLASLAGRVRWLGRGEWPAPFRGIVFSNELLDAMPIHRLGWDAANRSWFEWGVTGTPEALEWTRLPLPVAGGKYAGYIQLIPEVPVELACILPDGFTIEIPYAATAWWSEAAMTLAQGKLLTIDYGDVEGGCFRPERPGGTLRAYRDHQVCPSLLTDPGLQDLTAHVDFSAIRRAGEKAGLQTEALIFQEDFLTRIARQSWSQDGGHILGEWTSERTRQFLTLTHPNHLGRLFRVLIQSRGMQE